MRYFRPTVVVVKAYLASEDDDVIDRSRSLIFQELMDKVATRGACSYNGEVLVARHVLIYV